MGDPVSWLMIEPGWKVAAADGSEVGEVDEIAGDSSLDIFDGLAIATSAFGKPRYVADFRVIVQLGAGGHEEVHLRLRAHAFRLVEDDLPDPLAELGAARFAENQWFPLRQRLRQQLDLRRLAGPVRTLERDEDPAGRATHSVPGR